MSDRIRRCGVALIRDALAAGMGICFEVSFDDADVQWLTALIPELDRSLVKQGGQSGSAALPHSMTAEALLASRCVVEV